MATKKTHEQYVEEFQKKMNRWLKVREILGPEMCHTISEACRHMAEQYRKDMVATHLPQSDRVSEHFHEQAKKCEDIVEHLEL